MTTRERKFCGITLADITRVKTTQMNGTNTAITGVSGDVNIDHQ